MEKLYRDAGYSVSPAVEPINKRGLAYDAIREFMTWQNRRWE